ncbi:MAG: S8 family serine peptidase [Clostridiaceae bacterium]|nr:S8 family serine peptidase [Clostridiaceae bacterium]
MSVRKLFITKAVIAAMLIAVLAGLQPIQASDAPYDGYIVKMNFSSRRAGLSALADEGLQPVSYMDGLYLTDDLDSIESYIDSGLVEYIEPNYILEPLDDAPLSTPDDTRYPDQWTLDAINYLSLYQGGYNGSNVTLAIIDSGLYAWHDNEGTYHGHEEFETLNISQYSRNFLGTAAEEESSPYYYRDQRVVGHGTFVTSQIAAKTDNTKGISGIADGVEIMSLRCISDAGSDAFPYDDAYDANSGSVAIVAAAIRYAVDHGADVINMSLGAKSTTSITTLQDAINYANDNGVIVVAAAGNDGTTASFYPAACQYVIGVGSVSQSGDSLVRSTFSQHNTSISVTAPGGDVLGIAIYPGSTGVLYTDAGSSYKTSSGTSYSSPVVSALAAITKQVNNSLDHDDFESLLAVTSADYGTSGWDTYYGYGVLDAQALLTALTQTEYGISYELCDSTEYPASLPADSVSTYTLDREDDITLPTPTRDGYVFEGWFEASDYSGGAVDVLPMGALGTARSLTEDATVSYYIDNIKYYAKWSLVPQATLSSVSVLGYSAVIDGDAENTYNVSLPAEATASLAELEASDISAIASSGASAGIPYTNDGGATWTITVTLNSAHTDYTLNITLSTYSIPHAAEGKSQQTGTANLPSLDGLKATASFTADISSWFTSATAYNIVSCSGGGTAELNGAQLTYTPNGTAATNNDYEGRQVTIVLSSSNEDFICPETVTVTITINRGSSDCLITPLTAGYDLFTDSQGCEICITLFDNTLNGVYYNETLVNNSNYSITSDDDVVDSVSLTLSHNFISGLGTGAKNIVFRFSSGADRTLALTVSDSAPRYTVNFFSETTDIIPYSTLTNIRHGNKVTLPALSPAKTGYTFAGWYLSNGVTRITSNTVVTSGFSAYASWTSSGTPGGTGDGGGSGGGSSAGGTTKADAIIKKLPSDTSSFDYDALSAIIVGSNDRILLTAEGSNTGVSLSGKAASRIARSKSDILIKNIYGTISVPWEVLSSLDPGDNDQVYFAIDEVDSDKTLPDNSSMSSYDILKRLEFKALVYTSSDSPTSITDLNSETEIKVHIGNEYAGKSLTVLPLTDSSWGKAYETAIDSDGYTIFNPKKSVIMVFCSAKQSPSFNDVKEGAWYYSDVQYVFKKGFMNGMDDGAFNPDSTATRAMLATTIYRMAGSPSVAETGSFTDLSAGMWYTDAVSWASDNGIMGGYGNGVFGMNDPITREQLAVLLWRYAGSPDAGSNNISTFSDADSTSSYAVLALNWAVKNCILTGNGSGRLDPSGNATRAEIAAMLTRFDALINN